jgi:hypothetical protein
LMGIHYTSEAAPQPGAASTSRFSRGIAVCGQTIWNDRLAVVRSYFSREKATVAGVPPRWIAG